MRGQERQDHLAGRARIGGALEHHELAGPQPRGDGLGRIDDVGEVRLARVGQRSRDADDDDVGLIQPLEVDRGLESVLAHLADHRVGDVPDVAFAALEPGDLDRVDVEAQDRDPAVAERSGQREADVAQADDPDTHRRRFDPPQKGFMQQTRGDCRLPLCSLFSRRSDPRVAILGHWSPLGRTADCPNPQACRTDSSGVPISSNACNPIIA